MIALTAGVIVGIVLGFNGLGMERSVRPNQGIWRSAQNAVRIGLAIWLGVGVSLGLLLADAWRLALGGMQVLDVGAAVFLGVGLSFGIIASLFFGGQAVVQHSVLRVLLRRVGLIPWRWVEFLDFAAGLVLLQKVGGGYIFIHRLLLEYFADSGQQPRI